MALLPRSINSRTMAVTAPRSSCCKSPDKKKSRQHQKLEVLEDSPSESKFEENDKEELEKESPKPKPTVKPTKKRYLIAQSIHLIL